MKLAVMVYVLLLAGTSEPTNARHLIQVLAQLLPLKILIMSNARDNINVELCPRKI